MQRVLLHRVLPALHKQMVDESGDDGYGEERRCAGCPAARANVPAVRPLPCIRLLLPDTTARIQPCDPPPMAPGPRPG